MFASAIARCTSVPLRCRASACQPERASMFASASTTKPSEDPGVLAVEGDIADPATAGRVVGGALDRFGRIDTLVNAAAVVIAKPFTDYTVADYAAVAGVNLAGFFWVTQRAVAEMATRYGGHVVTVSVTLAEVADSGTPAVLTALTKGGLAAATRSLAVEYAAYGIRVNAVCPGIIATPMHPPEDDGGLGGRFPPIGRRTPCGTARPRLWNLSRRRPVEPSAPPQCAASAQQGVPPPHSAADHGT